MDETSWSNKKRYGRDHILQAASAPPRLLATGGKLHIAAGLAPLIEPAHSISRTAPKGRSAISQTVLQPDLASHRKTGIPVVLNTSFNENEPVVCTPEEAVDCFWRTRMDVLAIGPFMVVKPARATEETSLASSRRIAEP